MKTGFHLKELLKNKLFISCSAAILILAITVTTILLIPDKTPSTELDESSKASDVTVNPPDVNINNPTGNPQDPSSKTGTEETPSPDLNVDVGGNTKSPSNNDKNKTPAKDNEKPVTITTPSQPDGIIIGGDTATETKYDCKTANHHCINAENHAYITNLEIKGCPYCGSHSCPSFYYVSPAGIPICNPSLCPKYNEKYDPIKYCQQCGKKNGDGSDGTCVQFINACNCPNCGQFVNANTCHTCP